MLEFVEEPYLLISQHGLLFGSFDFVNICALRNIRRKETSPEIISWSCTRLIAVCVKMLTQKRYLKCCSNPL